VTGAEIGDASGLGGLGTRGSGPGGGGLSMSSVGLGSLGTAGRGGGGDGSYGQGVGSLGKKSDRDINISAGSPIVMGSLDKELIRARHQAAPRADPLLLRERAGPVSGPLREGGRGLDHHRRGTVRDSKIENSSMKQRRGRALHRLEDHPGCFRSQGRRHRDRSATRSCSRRRADSSQIQHSPLRSQGSYEAHVLPLRAMEAA